MTFLLFTTIRGLLINHFNSLQIHWYRNDRKLEENKIYRTQHEGNFFFIDLSSVSLFDSGRWTCQAENEVGRSHCSCEVSVLGKIVIDSVEKKEVNTNQLSSSMLCHRGNYNSTLFLFFFF